MTGLVLAVRHSIDVGSILRCIDIVADYLFVATVGRFAEYLLNKRMLRRNNHEGDTEQRVGPACEDLDLTFPLHKAEPQIGPFAASDPHGLLDSCGFGPNQIIE